MKKYLLILKIKLECAQKYIAIHKAPWPEMLQAIRDAGFVNEVIWFYEGQSIVYLECENYASCNAALRATEVCMRWDLAMVPRFSANGVLAEKIFDLNQQLADGLLLD